MAIHPDSSAHQSVAVGHALESRAARLRARVLHRHSVALAMSHHDALADDDGLLVADDHARVLRGEAGARAVGPNDRVAREYPAPAVVAGDIVARPRAVLGRREAFAEKLDGGGEPKRQLLRERHDIYCRLERSSNQQSEWSAFGFTGPRNQAR